MHSWELQVREDDFAAHGDYWHFHPFWEIHGCTNAAGGSMSAADHDDDSECKEPYEQE